MVKEEGTGLQRTGCSPAKQAERLHSMLRRLTEEDWLRLKEVIDQDLRQNGRAGGIEVLEKLLRKGEAVWRQDGPVLFQSIQALSDSAPILAEVKRADERTKARLRWVLREMSDEQWAAFKQALQSSLPSQIQADELAVMELVLRLGESVSNVEAAAEVRRHEIAGLKLLTPEVVRKNALLRVGRKAAPTLDPEAVYHEALSVFTEAEQLNTRAQNTLAYGYVQPSSAFRHARNTLFRLMDAILEQPELLKQAFALERELTAIPMVTREQMRWALHRLPVVNRMKVLRLIPLNTILMFQELSVNDVLAKATRDRRVAYGLFVEERSEEELLVQHGLSLNGLKNAVGALLDALVAKPLARKSVHEFLTWAQQVEPMSTAEVRRRVKVLSPAQRAELVNGIPPCVWKVREVMPLHKHLFLDYLSGEWVLGALVKYYNMHKNPGFAGRFNFQGTLTVRGAHAAIEGIMLKIVDEPVLRHKLRVWGAAQTPLLETSVWGQCQCHEACLEELMPRLPAEQVNAPLDNSQAHQDETPSPANVVC